MSRMKNIRYAKSLVKAIDQTPRLLIAYTGLFFYQEVIHAHVTGGLGGFDSGQGALNWRLKYYTNSFQKRPMRKVWGYKKKGRVIRPKSPAGYKSQRYRSGPKGSKPAVVNYLVEESARAFENRPKGFTSFVVYNPITTRIAGFEPGSPLMYPDNVFGELTKGTLTKLLRIAEQKAETHLIGILSGKS